jgi:hypothetical protein
LPLRRCTEVDPVRIDRPGPPRHGSSVVASFSSNSRAHSDRSWGPWSTVAVRRRPCEVGVMAPLLTLERGASGNIGRVAAGGLPGSTRPHTTRRRRPRGRAPRGGPRCRRVGVRHSEGCGRPRGSVPSQGEPGGRRIRCAQTRA